GRRPHRARVRVRRGPGRRLRPDGADAPRRTRLYPKPRRDQRRVGRGRRRRAPLPRRRVRCRHLPDRAAPLRRRGRGDPPDPPGPPSWRLVSPPGHPGPHDPDANAFITEVERRRDPSHVRAYRASEWKAFLRAAGLTVMDEGVVRKVRVWDEWTARTRMTPEARRDLEALVRRAPERCRAAFDFEFAGERIASFTDRMILVRPDRD